MKCCGDGDLCYISNSLSLCHFGDECGRNGVVCVTPRAAPICAGRGFEGGEALEQHQHSTDFLLSPCVSTWVYSNIVELVPLLFQVIVKANMPLCLFTLKCSHIYSQSVSLRYAFSTTLGSFSKMKVINRNPNVVFFFFFPPIDTFKMYR